VGTDDIGVPEVLETLARTARTPDELAKHGYEGLRVRVSDEPTPGDLSLEELATELREDTLSARERRARRLAGGGL
jgi:hypothetical protein